jgi:hypothetical protein
MYCELSIHYFIALISLKWILTGLPQSNILANLCSVNFEQKSTQQGQNFFSFIFLLVW